VASIAKAHGGTAYVDNVLEDGARFVLVCRRGRRTEAAGRRGPWFCRLVPGQRGRTGGLPRALLPLGRMWRAAGRSRAGGRCSNRRDLSSDPRARVAARTADPSAREFALAEMFCRHPDQVLTR